MQRGLTMNILNVGTLSLPRARVTQSSVISYVSKTTVQYHFWGPFGNKAPFNPGNEGSPAPASGGGILVIYSINVG